MKPLKSAFFIAGVFLVLGLSFFLMPEKGLSFFSLPIRNPLPAGKYTAWWTSVREGDKIPRRETPHTVAPDTLIHRDTLKKRSAPAPVHMTFADSLLRRVPSLEMSDTTRRLFFAVWHGMDSLRSRKKNLHILYYGDSQIEGDRITSVLRDTLQAHFGGGGPGFLMPVMTVPFTASFVTKPSPGWKKIDNYHVKGGRYRDIPFGLAGGFSLVADSLSAGEKKDFSCRVTVHAFAPPRALQFNRLEVWLYAPTEGPSLRVMQGGSVVAEQPSLPAGSLLCNKFSLRPAERKVKLLFSTQAPFAVEGIVLEDSVGVSVDNIPLRGRPFMLFSRCDPVAVRAMYDSLHVCMVVLQFGLNVAVGNMHDVRHYRRTLQRELHWLRSNFPDIFVLVVGVTDMGGDRPHLQEQLMLLRKEQRQTALREGCAFWDAYQAMGGDHAMARWARQNPSLARPDEAHMSREGSQLFAKMLLKALMEEYRSCCHDL